VKGGPFFNGRYTKGVPFLSKMMYKRVRDWTSGRSLPLKIFVEYPSPRALRKAVFLKKGKRIEKLTLKIKESNLSKTISPEK